MNSHRSGTRLEIESAVANIPVWRHRIDVGHGVTTPGLENCIAETRRLRLPEDLTGSRVLDVGCSDGYYSFLAERRGASVVGIDDHSSLLADGSNGFSIARELLGSQVEYRNLDVHDLPSAGLGSFDLILLINVLYHLKNPMLALEILADAARPGAKLILKTYFRYDAHIWLRGRRFGFDLGQGRKMWFFPSTQLGGDPTNWWAPNRGCIRDLLASTGWMVDDDGHKGGGETIWKDRIYCHATRA